MHISFPEMKDEVFINLLGYKEPNLVHLMRCKVGRVVVQCRVVEGGFSVLLLETCLS